MKSKIKSGFIILSLVIFLVCLIILQTKDSENIVGGFWGTSKVFAQKSTDLTSRNQPNSPLRISKLVNNSNNPNVAEISFTLENFSNQSVNAYSIRYIVVCGKSESEGVSLNNILSNSRVLQPEQITQDSLTDFGCSDTITSVNLSIDFVEFTDGRRWGDDRFKFGERLDGTRVGAQEETASLLSKFREQNKEAILEAISLNEINWSIPTGYSEEWINGYNAGRKSRRNQIQRVYLQNGINNIEQTLLQPYDASKKEKK